jgi:hypothetical protein
MTKRDELLERGFTKFPGVLPPGLLAELRAVTDDMLARQDHSGVRAQGSMLHTNRHPVFADLIALPEALGALAELGFPRPTFTDGYVISKPPRGPRLFWHYDWFAWEDDRSYENPPPQLFAMYYLTDTTRENGCLRVIPGSHVRENPLHRLLAEPHSKDLGAADDLGRPEFSDRPDETDVPVAAGDLLIGDARLLHAAHDNATDERRTLITLWYQPELESLPERIRAQMAAKTQPIPDDWPEPAREKVRPLRASERYRGGAEPCGRQLWRPRGGSLSPAPRLPR